MKNTRLMTLLMIGGLATFVSINMYAWSVRVTNYTKETITFNVVSYIPFIGCSGKENGFAADDKWLTVSPGEAVTANTGLRAICSVKIKDSKGNRFGELQYANGAANRAIGVAWIDQSGLKKEEY
jgi:hypothetical protein